MTALAYFMDGQNVILVHKSRVMNEGNARNSMECCVLMPKRGEEFFRLSPGSKTEDVSEYLAELCLECVELGYDKLSIILDNNPTHKQKMQSQLAVHLQQMGLSRSIAVEYLYLPPYSPKLNLVEYVIHLARLKLLHHLPMGTTLEQPYAKVVSVLRF